MKSKLLFISIVCAAMASCVSTKSTLKNVDDNTPAPRLKSDNTFVINVNSTDKKYGYDKDFPVNVFFKDTKSETLNIERFLNALAGPKGEPLTYKKIETCCPFPTKHTEIGAGFLDVYEVSWEGNTKPLKLYLNIYEKSVLMVPVGLTLKR